MIETLNPPTLLSTAEKAICEGASPKQPTVSVVIPTRGRPRLLARAIRSVLNQTLQDFEIVVVLDGSDPETTEIVHGFGDPRIHLLTLTTRAGGAAARNAGVNGSSGDWIAFLDDDDEFLPRKLELLVSAASRSNPRSTVVISQAIVRSSQGDQIWPARFPVADESVCEYLFCRKRLRQGTSFLQSSTFFVGRELVQQIPFRTQLNRHQDWDWIIQVISAPGTDLICINQPLSVYYMGHTPAPHSLADAPFTSVSRRAGWKESLAWGRDIVLKQSRSAYSFFVATQCVTRLERSDRFRWQTLSTLIRECFAVGKPSSVSAALFVGFWIRLIARETFFHSSKGVVAGKV